ncbi:DUF2752 domain-containing protein [bacterium]|nr:DUF2752 domain-containing protein [bacterium]
MRSIPSAALPTESPGALRARARRTALGLLALYGLSFALSPVNLDRLPNLCLWKAVIGIPCPFCGLSHSVAALSHGLPRLALHLNPFGPPLYAAGLALLALSLYTWRSGHDPLAAHPRLRRAAILAFGGAWGLWWLVTSLRLLF